MDDQAGGDLGAPVDNLCLPAEDLALDLRDRLWRIPADRASRAGLGRRPYLSSGDGIDGVHRADAALVELGGVLGEELDLLEFFLLDVEDGIRERIELYRVVPVGVPNDNPGDGLGIQPDVPHLLAEARPAAGGVPVEDVVQLLPAGIIKSDFPVRPFDDSEIDWKVDELDVVVRGRGADEIPVRHEGAEGNIHEP